MTNPVMLYAKTRLHWGFIVRQIGASAAQPAYPIPPPTTVVGAFANPLARLLGLGEPQPARRKASRGTIDSFMECLLKATLNASAAILETSQGVGSVIYEEPARLLAAPFKGGGSYEKAVKSPILVGSQEILPVQGLGFASAPSAVLALSWIVEKESLERCIGRSLSRTELEVVAWNVYRIGSREGVSATVDAGVIEKDDMKLIGVGEGGFVSLLYQPASCVSPRRGGSMVTEVILPSLSYIEEAFLVPAELGSSSALIVPPSKLARFSIASDVCKALVPRDMPEFSLAFKSYS